MPEPRRAVPGPRRRAETAPSGWLVAVAAAAPVLLIGGWSVAGTRQPASYHGVRDTISALAAHGATDRWIMTAALAGVGASYLVTAAGLRTAATQGRAVLAAGGLATVGVAAFPLAADGTSTPHRVVAGLAFGALAVWPALSWRRRTAVLSVPAAARPTAAAALRAPVAVAASAVLLGLVGWFVVELSGGTGRVGLAERVAAGAQAVWPLLVVLSVRASDDPSGTD